MKTIALIIPWFGPFHNYFDLWMKSASYNETVDFYVITSNSVPENCPENIKFIKMSFDDVKARLQKHVDVSIKLTTYKLCDFKPLYMEAFRDLIKDYDYCGYCDVDAIFGDIRHFLTDEVLTYERVLQRGHFSIYQNTEKMRTLYKRTDESNMAYSYKKAWTTNYSCYFDEFLAMDIVTELYCTTLKDQRIEKIVLDPPAHLLNFRSYTDSLSYYCVWDQGHLYRQKYKNSNSKDIVGEKEEFMYIHLQKRKMEKVSIDANSSKFYIIPNRFTLSSTFTYTASDEELYTKNHFKADRIKNIKKLFKFGLIDCVRHRIRRKRIDKWLRKNNPTF